LSTTEHNSDKAVKPRGQLKLLAIFGVVILPILAAWTMAKFEIGIPDSSNNKSDLVEPPIMLEDWSLNLEPIGYGSPWRLVVTSAAECDAACMELINEARQINVALGREAGRVEHLLASGQGISEAIDQRLERDYPRLERASFDPARYRSSLANQPEGWREGAQLWVIDPLGRIVLHRDPDRPGKRLLDDLKHLLKVSKVG